MRRAQLVIPDASPLISLAKATLGNAGMMKRGETYLDLLKAFNLPIGLIDHIIWEMTHRADKSDAHLISDWMSQNANLIEEIETSTGRNAARDYADKHIAPGKQAGELAMNEYLLEFSDYRLSEDIPVIVLFEEKKIVALMDDVANVRLISVPGPFDTSFIVCVTG
jgi:hypothetical protein